MSPSPRLLLRENIYVRVLLVLFGIVSISLSASLGPLLLTMVSFNYFAASLAISIWVWRREIPHCAQCDTALLVGGLVGIACCIACAALSYQKRDSDLSGPEQNMSALLTSLQTSSAFGEFTNILFRGFHLYRHKKSLALAHNSKDSSVQPV